MSLLSMLNKTCTVSSKSMSQSSTSGGNVTARQSTSDVACAVQIDKSYQATIMGKETGVVEAWFYFPHGTTVDVGYRLTAVTGYTGHTFEVITKNMDDVGRGAYTKVLAVSKDGGGVR
jgi:hypothetical protein